MDREPSPGSRGRHASPRAVERVDEMRADETSHVGGRTGECPEAALERVHQGEAEREPLERGSIDVAAGRKLLDWNALRGAAEARWCGLRPSSRISDSDAPRAVGVAVSLPHRQLAELTRARTALGHDGGSWRRSWRLRVLSETVPSRSRRVAAFGRFLEEPMRAPRRRTSSYRRDRGLAFSACHSARD